MFQISKAKAPVWSQFTYIVTILLYGHNLSLWLPFTYMVTSYGLKHMYGLKHIYVPKLVLYHSGNSR